MENLKVYRENFNYWLAENEQQVLDVLEQPAILDEITDWYSHVIKVEGGLDISLATLVDMLRGQEYPILIGENK